MQSAGLGHCEELMFFQRERNGATLKPKGVDVVFRLDTAVVVIDGTKPSSRKSAAGKKIDFG
jgi:hypothetical protein